MNSGAILNPSFYLRDDVTTIARDLLGKVLVTDIDGVITSGMITETEAYAGVGDKASHSFGGRRTRRTEIMYAEGGVAYVYLCYGIHHLFNVVTNFADIPHAVLVRSIEPLEGLDMMLLRRKYTMLKPQLTSGPGAMSAALGITTALNNTSLDGPEIFIEDRKLKVHEADITTTIRVGVDYAGDDALLPYRFYLTENKFVSRRLPMTKK